MKCMCLSYCSPHTPFNNASTYLLERHGRHPLRPIAAQRIQNRALRLRTVSQIARTRIYSHRLALLRPAIHMLVVPHLAQHRVPVITRPLTRSRGIEARPRAPDERNAAVLLGQRVFKVRVRVGGAVGGDDVFRFQPLVGREALVVFDRGGEEVDDFLVLAVQRAVAGDVEGAEARGVLAELVAPEAGVVLVLRGFSTGGGGDAWGSC